jgi:beta-1,4-mannosyl-glycoprotein beta-1,4-N-acetylglucosaminyltransferase
MKIFDCFIFFNELELLELRFMELYDAVDYFVIVEANITHTGKPKTFIFEENKNRYKAYLDKVIYVKVEDCPQYSLENISIVEHFQRNAIARGLNGVAVKGDKILVSDLDEIPRAELVIAHANKPGWKFFQSDLFYYYVNCQVIRPWGGTTMADYGSYTEPQQLRRFTKRHSRYVGESNDTIIIHGCWHYSYLTGGDPDKLRIKVENIYESSGILPLLGTREEVIEKMEKHLDPYGRELRKTAQTIVDISKTKPKSMDKFLEKYPQFFYNENKK